MEFRIVDVFGSFFVFKQKTAYEVRISDWSSDVCSSDLIGDAGIARHDHSGDLPRRAVAAVRADGVAGVAAIAPGIAQDMVASAARPVRRSAERPALRERDAVVDDLLLRHRADRNPPRFP